MTNLKDTLQAASEKQRAQRGQKPTVGSISAPQLSFVNLTIRVQKNQRLHWLIEAKKQDTSLTAAIIEALTARFGSPNSP